MLSYHPSKPSHKGRCQRNNHTNRAFLRCPVDAREELIELLQKRTIEERRSEIARDVRSTRSKYKKGKSKRVSSNELMKELLS